MSQAGAVLPFEAIPGWNDEGWPSKVNAELSLHEHLCRLHARYGAVVGTFMGGEPIVSLGSSDVLRQTRHLFNRPAGILAGLKPIYTENGLAFASGEDALARRRAYINPSYSPAAVRPMSFAFVQGAARLVCDWKKASSPIPLQRDSMRIAAHTFAVASMGMGWENTEEIDAFTAAYAISWSALDTMAGRPTERGSDTKAVELAVAEIYRIAGDIFDRHVSTSAGLSTSNHSELFTRMVDGGITRPQAVADTVAIFIAGFHTTAALLTWVCTYLALNEDVQATARREIIQTAPADADRSAAMVRALIDETLRLANVAPIAARCSDEPLDLGGYHVPAGTPLVQALGYAANDPTFWPDHGTFSPGRFCRHEAPAGAFFPFGFAGKRVCPGVEFTYAEVSVFLEAILRNFRIGMDGTAVPRSQYGIVTVPEDEIFLRVEAIEGPLES